MVAYLGTQSPEGNVVTIERRPRATVVSVFNGFKRLQNVSTTGEDSSGLVRTPEEWINAPNHFAINGL
jgi:hypothetical protein